MDRWMVGWMEGLIDTERQKDAYTVPVHVTFFIHVHFDPGAAHNQFAEVWIS